MQKYVVRVELGHSAMCMYSKKQLNKNSFVYEVFDGNKLFYISEEQYDKLEHKFKEEGYETVKKEEHTLVVVLKGESREELEKELEKLEVEYEIVGG